MWMLKYLLQFEPFPFFDIAHNLLAAVELRNELGDNRESFPRNNPFASWLFSIAFIFSGSLTANLLLGEPVIAPLGNTKQLVVATIIWFLVVFFASDIFYKFGTAFPIKLIASVLNEIYRARKIVNGIVQSSQFYPNSWIIMIAIATIRANGSGFVKILMRLIRKTQTPKDPGFMQLSFSTKISMLAAFFLVLERTIGFIGSFDLLHFGVVLFFIYAKICLLYGLPTEKVIPVNHLMGKILRNTHVETTKFSENAEQIEKLKDTRKED